MRRHYRPQHTSTKRYYHTSSSAVAKRLCDASYLSVVSFNSIQYLDHSFFIISYFGFGFTSAYTIRFCSVVFGITSSQLLSNTRSPTTMTVNSAWSVSRLHTRTTVTAYSAWRIYRPKYYTVTLKSRLRVTQGHW